jgi:putative membrane protein
VADLDPDARFLLANERTMLAWLRTSLALQAGGVGIVNFASSLNLNGVIGLVLIGLGGLAGAAGFYRYRAADQAIRRGVLPPTGTAPQVLAVSVAVLAVLLLGVALGHELNL